MRRMFGALGWLGCCVDDGSFGFGKRGLTLKVEVECECEWKDVERRSRLEQAKVHKGTGESHCVQHKADECMTMKLCYHFKQKASTTCCFNRQLCLASSRYIKTNRQAPR